jgi:hypothetical protein
MATEEATHDLVEVLKKQLEIQEEINGIMRGLISAMQAVAQETQELRELLEKQSSL